MFDLFLLFIIDLRFVRVYLFILYFKYLHTVLLLKEMETVDIQAVESKLSDVTVTAIPMAIPKQPQVPAQNHSPTPSVSSTTSQPPGQSKYAQLLGVIEEMGREVRPTYAGSRSSTERLKRNLVSARILVRECLLETERSARQ